MWFTVRYRNEIFTSRPKLESVLSHQAAVAHSSTSSASSSESDSASSLYSSRDTPNEPETGPISGAAGVRCSTGMRCSACAAPSILAAAAQAPQERWPTTSTVHLEPERLWTYSRRRGLQGSLGGRPNDASASGKRGGSAVVGMSLRERISAQGPRKMTTFMTEPTGGHSGQELQNDWRPILDGTVDKKRAGLQASNSRL